MADHGGSRAILARGAAPEPERLRTAYLDLLKIALCDLVGPATTSVEGRTDGRVASRELSGAERELRAEGRDWPLHGLTMTGLRRLDDLQACLETVVAEEIAGDVIEAGSWRGGSSILARATLDSLGATNRTLWVADSFAGFPGADAPREYDQSLGPYFAAFDFLTAPLADVRESFSRLGYGQGVRFVPGFFADTLPRLAGHRWSLVRLDGDTYDATMLSLRCLYPGLAEGGYLVVDDFGALSECREAVEAFRAEYGIEDPIEQVDWTCARWRRGGPAGPPFAPGAGSADEPFDRPTEPPARPGRVPTVEELALADELEHAHADAARRESALCAELVEVREELATVTGSLSWRVTLPLRRAAGQLRERRRAR